MQNPVYSTIGQLLYGSRASVNFARIVAEMEQVLTRLKPDLLRISWDCDDLVFFDLAETRITLAFADVKGKLITTCLTVSVGPHPQAATPDDDPGFDLLCSRIVERLQSRFVPLAVLWSQTPDPVGADLIDAMTDKLPQTESGLPPIEGLIDPLWRMAEQTARAQDLPPLPETATVRDRRRHRRIAAQMAEKPAMTLVDSPAANDMPAVPAPRSAELARLREALYPANPILANERMSTQMRLAVHAMNATLIMVWMPLGATVMTYSILKGEDMRLSGRIMALTGTFLAFAHSPFAHSVAAAVAQTLS